MPEADIVYADVQFIRSQDVVSGVTSSSAATTYDEVNFSKSPSTQQRSSRRAAAEPSPRSGRRRRAVVTLERGLLLTSTLLLAAALAALAVVFLENRDTKRNMEKLQRDLKNLTESQVKANQVKVDSFECPEVTPSQTGSCRACGSGWEHHRQKCYHVTNAKLTWSLGRVRCQQLGGDLVVIESREEQRYLNSKVRDRMTNDEDKFWIGLTDSHSEGIWTWVDGSPLSLSFWLGEEPDNWKGENPEGEDCVRMGEKSPIADLKCWTDKSCTEPHRSICEKNLESFTCF